jgi:carbamoyltransferase
MPQLILGVHSGSHDAAVFEDYSLKAAVHLERALFYSPWDDALIVTADGGGDNVHYSHRHFAAGRLTSLYGGDDMILKPAEEDSLGKMYGWATRIQAPAS